MDIDGYDGRFNPNDARQFAPKVADPRAAGLSGEAGDDVQDISSDSESLAMAAQQNVDLNAQAAPRSSNPMIADEGFDIVLQRHLTHFAHDLDQKYHKLARALGRELKLGLDAIQKLNTPEGRDEGIREHMRVIQGQTRTMQHECLAKLEALKDIGATEFNGASEALFFLARDIKTLARRAIVVSVSVNVILGCVLAATIIW